MCTAPGWGGVNSPAAHIVLCFTFVAKKMLPTNQCFAQQYLHCVKAFSLKLPSTSCQLPCSKLYVTAVCFLSTCLGSCTLLEYSARHSSHTISLRGWLCLCFPTCFHNLFLWTNFIPSTAHFMRMNSLCFTSSTVSHATSHCQKEQLCLGVCKAVVSRQVWETESCIGEKRKGYLSGKYDIYNPW